MYHPDCSESSIDFVFQSHKNTTIVNYNDFRKDGFMKQNILIVEDDSALLEIMTDFFSGNHYQVTSASAGFEAIEAAKMNRFDIILLDVNLPDLSGFEVCRRMKESADVSCPVLFITARASEADKLSGYASGGYDYITKPFSLPVLNAKIKAILNRSGRETILKYGPITINQDSHCIYVNDCEIHIAPKEYELFCFLAENSGRLYSREALIIRIWGYEFEGSDRAVDDHIRKLRKALGKHADCIQTVRGSGYRFVMSEGETK